MAGWLARVRGDAGTEEIRLGPLSRAEVAGQAAALAGRPGVTPGDRLPVRARGGKRVLHRAAGGRRALAGRGRGGLRVPAGLPARLAELLAARAGRCAGDARAVLAGWRSRAGAWARTLLAAVTGLEAEAVRRGLRELAAARLLAEDTTGGGHRPRHALLGEAVAAGLLPGERAVLHERTARALAAAGDPALAGEAAGHWRPRAARRRNSRPGWRRPRPPSGCRLRRGRGALAAGHRAVRGPARCRRAAGIDVPRLYVRAIDALYRAGDRVRAWPGRRGGLPPVRRPRRPRHRRGRLPPRRGGPGEGCAGRRAAADGGGAAPVRAGSAVLRSHRGPARLHHHLPAVRRGTASGRPTALDRALEIAERPALPR